MREIKFRAWDGDQEYHDIMALKPTYKQHGYIKRKVNYHPFSDRRGYVMEHRLVVEQSLEAFLPKHAIIHHINGVRDDNRLENLSYMEEQVRHAKHHDTGKRNANGQFVATDPAFNEIKFRLLNKNTGLMQIMTLAKLMSTTFRNSQFEFRGRFTGLKDKHGKEIYEGDIVTQDGIGTALVAYKGSAFVLLDPSSDWPVHKFEDLEVIGNIYETPELLETNNESPHYGTRIYSEGFELNSIKNPDDLEANDAKQD